MTSSVSAVIYNVVFGGAKKYIYEDDQCVVYDELQNPQAPVHFVVVPRKRLARLHDATEQDEKLLGHLLLTARRLASDKGISSSGFRVVQNNGPQALQRGDQLCVQVLGGRQMFWPFS